MNWTWQSTVPIVWQPIASPLHILAATVVLAGLAVFAYARTFRGGIVATSGLLAMRLAMIASLAVLLMGPSEIPPQMEQPVRPRLRILLDTSESMLTKDCGGLSRFEFVQEHVLNESRLRSLARDFQIEMSGFDESIHPLPLESLHRDPQTIANGHATHLAECLTSFLARNPTSAEGAAVVVISDGRDTQGDPISPAAEFARRRKIPVFAVAVGRHGIQSDLAVMAVPMQDYLLPGEPGAILVKVFQSGLGDAKTTLAVEHGNVRQVFPVEFNHRQMVQVEVPVKKDEPGQYEYHVSVEPVHGETQTENNRQTVFCEVQKKRIRVLILEGQPFWDSKFLSQSLRKDEHVEVTQITQLSSTQRETIVGPDRDAVAKIPSLPEEWARYDVVILGQQIENLLRDETAALLDEFVSDHGGHLVFARGMAYNPETALGRSLRGRLAKMEPVVWGTGPLENLSLALTPTGRSSQWFATAKIGVDADLALAQLPGFEKTTVVERAKPATIVLAQASAAGSGAAAHSAAGGQPAIVRMSYGRGTVVGVLGEGLWRWSLLPPDKQNLFGFYDSFWSNLVRWLAMGGEFSPDQHVAVHLSRNTLRRGDPLAIDIVYKHAPPSGAHPKLELSDPSHRRREIALEAVASREPRYLATLTPETVGVYEVDVHSSGMQPARQKLKFNVYDPAVERLMTAADPMSLRLLAEHSGGRFIEAEQLADFPDMLRQFRASEQVPPRLEYAWDQGAIMVLLLVWSGMEWVLRRWAGLL